MDDDPRRWAWVAWAVALLLAVLIFWSHAKAQDAPADPIRCSGGWCLVPEVTLVRMSMTLAQLREQATEYARLCRWGSG